MKKLKIVMIAAAALSLSLAANAQNKYGATPDDSIACISNVSLYQEFYKQKAYTDCYEPWRQIILHCPRFSKAVYQRGERIMDAMIKSATTDEERQAYLKELMDMYDTRIANFGEEAKVLCMKATTLSQYNPKAVKEIYEIYDAAVKANVNEIDENYITLFFKATVDYVQAGFADATLIIDNYDIATTRLEEIVEQVVEDTLKVQKISGYINNVDAVFSPYANCEQLVEIYQNKFNENPNDVLLLRKITDIMMRKGCTESQLFFSATENLYNLEPSPSTAMRMGTMCYGKKQYAKAVEYIQDAVKGLTEKKDLYRAYLTLGMSYNGQNSYSAARAALLKAAEIDRTKGEPYIALAQVYASSYRSIDDGMGGRSAYWAAVDECRHAKSVEPTEQIANVADRLIGTYAAYFPKKNDAFMLNLIDGQSYVVPGWIGKSTVIRTR
jgi:tetratricopeptide (TPR) repeat protein